VTNLGGGFATLFSGNLEASGTSVGSFTVVTSRMPMEQTVTIGKP
jgi:hypothetical protein